MIKSTSAMSCLDKHRIGNPTKSLVIQNSSGLRVLTWNSSDERARVQNLPRSSFLNPFLIPNRLLSRVESFASLLLTLSNRGEMWVGEHPSKLRIYDGLFQEGEADLIYS